MEKSGFGLGPKECDWNIPARHAFLIVWEFLVCGLDVIVSYKT